MARMTMMDAKIEQRSVPRLIRNSENLKTDDSIDMDQTDGKFGGGGAALSVDHLIVKQRFGKP